MDDDRSRIQEANPMEQHVKGNASEWLASSPTDYRKSNDVLMESDNIDLGNLTGENATLFADNIVGVDRNQLDNPTLKQVCICVQMVAAIPCVFGNLLIILLYIRHSRLRTQTNKYIINLAFSDLLVALAVIPYESTFLWLPAQTFKAICLGLNISHMVFLGSSLLAMLLISVDRYIAVAHPFVYMEKITPRLINIMIIASWITVIVTSVIPVTFHLPYPENKGAGLCSPARGYPSAFGTNALLLLVFFINILLYLSVARVALRQQRRVYNESHGNLYSDLHSTRLMVFLSGVYIICWLPYMLVLCLYFVSAIEPYNCNHCEDAWTITRTCVILNSCLNNFLYTSKKKDFNWAFKRFFTINRRRTPPEGAAPPNAIATRNHAETTFTISSRLTSRRTELTQVSSAVRLLEPDVLHTAGRLLDRDSSGRIHDHAEPGGLKVPSTTTGRNGSDHPITPVAMCSQYGALQNPV